MIPLDLDDKFFCYDFSGVEIFIQMSDEKVKDLLDFVQQHGKEHGFYLAFDKDCDLYVYDMWPDVIEHHTGDLRIDTVFTTEKLHIHIGKARLKWESDIEYITTVVAVSGAEVQKHITTRDITRSK